jgi:hypothetical protein
MQEFHNVKLPHKYLRKKVSLIYYISPETYDVEQGDVHMF